MWSAASASLPLARGACRVTGGRFGATRERRRHAPASRGRVNFQSSRHLLASTVEKAGRQADAPSHVALGVGGGTGLCARDAVLGRPAPTADTPAG